MPCMIVSLFDADNKVDILFGEEKLWKSKQISRMFHLETLQIELLVAGIKIRCISHRVKTQVW